MVIKKFTANGKPYEIRLIADQGNITVRAFTGDKPANGYSYNVTFETACDISAIAGVDAVRELVKIAEEDVVKQRYEGFLNALAMLKLSHH